MDSKHLEDMGSNPDTSQLYSNFNAMLVMPLAEHFSKCARSTTYHSKTTRSFKFLVV